MGTRRIRNVGKHAPAWPNNWLDSAIKTAKGKVAKKEKRKETRQRMKEANQ